MSTAFAGRPDLGKGLLARQCITPPLMVYRCARGDLICMQFDDQQKFHKRAVLLFDIGAALTVHGDSTVVLLPQPVETHHKVVRAGAGGRDYLLAANFGSKEAELKLAYEAARRDVLSGPLPVSTERSQSIRLMPGETSLLMFER